MTIVRRGLAGLVALLSIWTSPAHAAAAPRSMTDGAIAEARASMLVDPRAAREKARIAEQQSGTIADPVVRATVQATALWLQGEADNRLKDFAQAAPKLDRARQLARAHAPGSALEGDVLIASGSTHGNTGQVVAALREYQQGYAIFVKLKDARKQAIALICIAGLYNDAKDYEAALKYFDQALAVFSGDPQLRVSTLNNRALALRNIGRYATAEQGFRAALAIADTMHSPVLKAQILKNIAKTQLKRNDLDGAARTIAQGEAVAREADAFNQQALRAVAAQAALQRGDMRTAAALIEDSVTRIDGKAASLSARDAHETAYRVFHALGEDGKAYDHLMAVKQIDDDTTELATSTGAALMAARFDFANQELKIARLKADDLERRIAAAKQRARVQRWVFYGGAAATSIVIAALLAGLVVARRSRDRVRAANQDLALANTALGKALAAKTEFLATTSHEIRTPLNGILGMTQVMLADRSLPEATRERLTVVQAAGTTMRTLVDDILDVAKMENGKLVLETAPFDLKATIVDATRLWDTQATSKGIAFRRALDDCPTLVAGDAARVRQVVFNLLSNALKFTDAGEIAISAEQRDDGQVAIAVSDSGIGIPEGKLEAIFESFRQADAGTTRRFGGTGLGLAICRQLARAMGGDVRVESRVGEGSIFTVTLPLAEVVPAAGDAAAEAAIPALLVVERNPIARSLLKTLLSPYAERIVFASDVDAAVAILGSDHVTRVLADEATLAAGGDAKPAVAAIATAARHAAPVTLLWSNADEDVLAGLRAIGAEDVLSKPVSGPSLVATLFRLGNDSLVRRAA